MNALITIIPILLIRYGLLGVINKDALRRAGYFAPLVGGEKTAYWVYQITTLLMVLCLSLVKIEADSVRFYAGMAVYLLGLVSYTVSIVNFATPKKTGLNLTGLYQLSRNPMYTAYFVCFLGCVLLTGSWVLLSLLMIFQVSAHWIIRSEERWCINRFGEEYLSYMRTVRRYF